MAENSKIEWTERSGIEHNGMPKIGGRANG